MLLFNFYRTRERLKQVVRARFESLATTFFFFIQKCLFISSASLEKCTFRAGTVKSAGRRSLLAEAKSLNIETLKKEKTSSFQRDLILALLSIAKL